jgi:hypothetical protein
MKITIMVALLASVAFFQTSVLAQTIEMAADCDQVRMQLGELIKRPDTTDTKKIKESLGLDILNSCDRDGGQIICYQCLDKDQNLRTLQLFQERHSKKFELLGFGCRCRDEK